MDWKMLTGPGLIQGLMMSGYEDPTKGAMPYFNQIPDTLKQYYEPYSQLGQRQMPGLENQYSDLVSHPGDILNKIGQGYHESPGYKFKLQQALQAAGNAAAAGGMAGSPQHQQEAMGVAEGIANQDYEDYLSHALGLYGIGTQGRQGLFNTGFNASTNLADALANTLGAQGQLAYSGIANRNMAEQGAMGEGLGLIGSALGKGFF